MASPGNQHCANCIGTLSFPFVGRAGATIRRPSYHSATPPPVPRPRPPRPPWRWTVWLAEICIIASAVNEVKHVWLEQLLLAESAELACSVASCMSVYTVQSSARPVVPIDRCNDWNWNWNCVPNLDNFTTARRSSQRVCQLNTTELNTQYKLSVINWTVVGRTMVTIQ